MPCMTHLPDHPGRLLAWAMSQHHSCSMFLRMATGRRAWQKCCTPTPLKGGTTFAAATPACSSATSGVLIQRAINQPHDRSSWQHLPGSPRGYRCRLCLEVDFATRGHLAEHLVRASCAGCPARSSHCFVSSSERGMPGHPGGTEACACGAARGMPLLRGGLPRQGRAAGARQAQLHGAGEGLHPQRPDQAHAAGGLRPGPLLRRAVPGAHGWPALASTRPDGKIATKHN